MTRCDITHVITWICCISIIIVPIISIVVLKRAALPTPYQYATDSENWQSSLSSLSSRISQGATALALWLHPSASHLYVNREYNVCWEPLQYACNPTGIGLTGKHSIMSLVMEYNDRVIAQIHSESRYNSRFIEYCTRFHAQSMNNKIQELWSSDFYKEIYSRIHDATLDTPAELYQLIGWMHSVGVREPFRISRDKSGRKYFTQSILMHKIGVNIDYDTLTDTQVSNYMQIHNAIWSSGNDLKLHATTEIQYRTNFAMDAYNITGDIYTDLRELAHFNEQIPRWKPEQWRDYLWISALKSILHHLRMVTFEDERVCYTQTEQYFPTKLCRRFKELTEIVHVPDDIERVYKAGFKDIVIRDNIYGFHPEVLAYIEHQLENLEFIVDKCVIPDENSTVTDIENKYWNSDEWGSYIGIISKLMQEPDFEQRRGWRLSGLTTGFVSNMLGWNAMYTTIGNKRIIFVPPGLLTWIHRYLKRDSCHYHALFDTTVFHEMGHWLVSIIDNIPDHLKGHESDNTGWNLLRSRVWRLYNTEYDSVTVYKEGLGDHIGFKVAINNWKKRHYRTDENIQCFILSYLRFACPGETATLMHDENHAPVTKRAILPVCEAKEDLHSIWKCNTTESEPYRRSLCD
jgi:hypothetical protein